MSRVINQTVTIPASPTRIFDALTQSEQFTAFTAHGEASIDPSVGGAIRLFGGAIEGRNVELVPGKRVVQAWRNSEWAPGVYSLVRFELSGDENETTIDFEHTGFPEDSKEHLTAGWHQMYWEPLKAFVQR